MDKIELQKVYPELCQDEINDFISPLLDSFGCWNDSSAELDDFQFSDFDLTDAEESFPFESIFSALASAVFERQCSGFADDLVEDSDIFYGCIINRLKNLFSRNLMRALIEFMKVKSFADSSLSYDDYVSLILHSSINEFLSVYASGWTRTLVAAQNILNSTKRMIERINADRIILNYEFGIPLHEKIAKIEYSGDTHNEGASVCVVLFSNDYKIVYKPRSVSGELGYYSLIQKINEKFSSSFTSIKAFSRGSYGYVQHIDADDSVKNWHSLGQLACLMYVLRATDMHFENVVWYKGQPVPLDLETLFHPEKVRVGKKESKKSAYRALRKSVYGTGILPLYISSKKNSGSANVGFVQSGADSFSSPFNEMGIYKPFSTEMEVVWMPRDNKPLPLIQDLETRSKIYQQLNEVLSGFEEFYILVLQNLDDFKDIVNTSFVRAKLRYVHLPTIQYSQVARSLTNQTPFKDGVLAKRLLARIAIPSITSDPSITHEECRQLWRGDIPYFYTEYGKTIIFSEGREISRIENSPKNDFELSLELLSEDDLEFQLKVTRLAYTARLADPSADYSTKLTTNLSIGSGYSSASKKDALVRLADKVCRDIRDDRFDHLPNTWIGPVARMDRSEWSPGVLGYDLYGGRTGIALALCYAGMALNESSYIDVASKIFDKSSQILLNSSYEDRSLFDGGIGGLSGTPGLFWSLSVCGKTLKYSKWESAAKVGWKLVGNSLLYPFKKTDFDMVSGILSSIIMQFETTNKFSYSLQDIDKIASDILNLVASSSTSAGFAHGLAGYLYFLCSIPEYKQTSQSRNTIKHIIGTLNRAYRNPEGMYTMYLGRHETISSSWCNGVSGMLLAYAKAYESGMIDEGEILSILHQLQKIAIPHLPILCHGSLGVLSIVKDASKMTDFAEKFEPLYSSLVDIFADPSDLIKYFDNGKTRYSLSPGLMCGKSSAIYWLSQDLCDFSLPSVFTWKV